MDQNNPWNLQLEYNQRKLFNKAQFFPHKPYFPFISQGHSKLTPVNS